MRKAAARLSAIDLSTVGVTRLLVVSYFIGLALGLVQGVDIGVLFMPFAGDTVAAFLSTVLLIGLSTLILIDIHRRPAALVLALVLFWASYLTMVSQTGSDQIATFWRDLALIGALLLAYGQSGEATENTLPTPANTPNEPTGQSDDTGVVFPNSPYAAPSGDARSQRRQSQRKRVRTEIYRQDLEVIRTS